MDISLLIDKEIRSILDKANNYTKKRNGKSFYTEMIPNMIKKTIIRKSWAKKNVQIPPFLIASIASTCNLNCSGCYARKGGGCFDHVSNNELSEDQWDSIFNEAEKLGVSFVLLAGGEPSMRMDVLRKAGEHNNMLFPVFTNGTVSDSDILKLYKENDNLIPIISIEGDEDKTDQRRGMGVFSQIKNFTSKLKAENIMFGVSITVTKENYIEVSDAEFIKSLHDDGCGAVIFVEYVPSDESSYHLVLDESDLKKLDKIMNETKKRYNDLIIISFPGDEDMMGGCLAAGRGFFHINPVGGAEPCPFSPYSTMNLKESSIIDVLRSDFFRELRNITKENHEHYGGCTLFNKRESVTKLLIG